jgi:glycine zipper 2TM protein
MRSILIGSAAAILAISTASPAFAQYGGSPDAQVDGAAADEPDSETGEEPGNLNDDMAYPDEADDMSAEDQGAFEDAGPPPEDAYRDDADQDVDQDVDLDVDQDQDVDQDAGEPGQTWQGEDGRSYCRRSDGTTGLIVGGGAGALIGRGIDSRGRRGTGTILGAIAGAVVGSAIERSANDQRCR